MLSCSSGIGKLILHKIDAKTIFKLYILYMEANERYYSMYYSEVMQHFGLNGAELLQWQWL
jgi:hypothetical protein